MDWKVVADVIKLTWGKLSEEDLTAIAGRRDQLAERLQERYGYEKVDTLPLGNDYFRWTARN